jgi:hypothetical protein
VEKSDDNFSNKVSFAIDEGNYHIDDLARSKILERIKEGYWPAIRYKLDKAKPYDYQKMDMIFKIIDQGSDSDYQDTVDKQA